MNIEWVYVTEDDKTLPAAAVEVAAIIKGENEWTQLMWTGFLWNSHRPWYDGDTKDYVRDDVLCWAYVPIPNAE